MARPSSRSATACQRGTTLIEVLVTMVVLAFGLLGIAAFQAKAQVGSIESYQRAQAVVLLEDMHARMLSNPDSLSEYKTDKPLGTGSTESTDCAGKSGAAFDKCEWNAALQGAAEVKGDAKLGAMNGARGCIEELQPRNNADKACQPGIYLVTVAWQGMHPTIAPPLACGKGAYGDDDTHRRAIATRVSVGTPSCVK